MLSLTVTFLLGLLQLISCQNSDKFLKDVCLRKIYECGNHRSRITQSSEPFETDPHKFKKICRNNDKFIACVDDALLKNCNGSISDLALKLLNDNLSLKMFCKNLEWRKSYFSSVSCINEYKENVEKYCEYEESIHVDDRPWCLIPEHCDSLQRVFNCTVQKIKGLCGKTAAEVYRRIQILNSYSQDVLCEIRRQDPSYCRYKRQKRSIDANPKDRVASSSGLHEKYKTDAMHNVMKASLIDAVKNIEQKQKGFSGIIDSDKVKLRKLLSIAVETPNRVENSSKLFKRFGSQESNPDLKVPKTSSDHSETESSTETNFESNKNINAESDSDSQENDYSFIKDAPTRSRVRQLDREIFLITSKTLDKRFSKFISPHLVGTDDDPFYYSIRMLPYVKEFYKYQEDELSYYTEELKRMREHQKKLTRLMTQEERESSDRERLLEEFVRTTQPHPDAINQERAWRKKNEEREVRHARSKNMHMAHDELIRKEQEIESLQEELHAYKQKTTDSKTDLK